MEKTTGKVITCKAAVVWGPGEPFVMEQIQVDPPQKMEVRIKILFTSICHTDLSAWKGENEAQSVFPRIIGHEAAGVVESVGGGVTDMKEGDHVIPIFNGECGDCKSCKRQTTNVCNSFGVNPMKSTMNSDGKTRFYVKGKNGSEEKLPVYHFLNTSTFSEYTVMESACVVKIDTEAPLKKMTLLSCGVSTGVGAAWNVANVQQGSTVAVFGLGAVGLAVAAGAKARGASKIIGIDIDINPNKITKGQVMGVTDFINPSDPGEPLHERIRELTDGGVDYSFECIGKSDVLREAFLSTHEGWGFTVILGIHATPNMLPLHPMELFVGRELTGCVFGGFRGKSQLPRFAKDCMRGVIDLDEFITHELPFEKINDAFKLLVEGQSLRCVLHL